MGELFLIDRILERGSLSVHFQPVLDLRPPRPRANYMMICECRPDYLKVDRYFVAGCHADFHRRAVLASIEQLAGPFGARVVAEGVEDPADMDTLKRIGISLVQGFLFGEPAPAAETLARVRSTSNGLTNSAGTV